MSQAPTALPRTSPPSQMSVRLQRMRATEPAPLSQTVLLTGEKLHERRTFLGLSRAQLGALALVHDTIIRHAEVDGYLIPLAAMIRLEWILHALEVAAAEARAACGLPAIVVTNDQAS